MTFSLLITQTQDAFVLMNLFGLIHVNKQTNKQTYIPVSVCAYVSVNLTVSLKLSASVLQLCCY